MNVKTTIKHHPVARFITLTLALSFAAFLLPLPPEGAFAIIALAAVAIPTIVACTLVALMDGRPGVSAFLRQCFRWRSPLKWYLIAVAIGFVIHFGSSLLALLTGTIPAIEITAPNATLGYEQIESFINFPNTIFQVLGVTSSYSANGGTNPNAATKLYADGCGWVNDPISPNYRSCTGVGNYGGNITVAYTVKIIGGGGTSQVLNTLIYDFSGSSYHYNSDFSASSRIAAIINPTDLSITKSAPTPSPLQTGATGTFTLTVTNVSANDATGTTTVSDTLPAQIDFVCDSGTGWNCIYNSSTRVVACTNPGLIE